MKNSSMTVTNMRQKLASEEINAMMIWKTSKGRFTDTTARVFHGEWTPFIRFTWA